MRRKTILVLCLSLLAAVTLVAAGCGGGGKKSAATTEAVTTEAATTQAATTEAATTQAATTEAATTTGGADLSFLKGKCKDVVNLSQQLATAMSGASTGNVGDAATALKKEAAVLQDFGNKAPSDISGDFKIAADYITKVADAIGGIKVGQVPDAATLQKLQALQTDTAKWTTAWTHISTWLTQNCHA